MAEVDLSERRGERSSIAGLRISASANRATVAV